MPGYGQISLVPTGWGQGGAKVEILNNRVLVPHMGARAYFSDKCQAGKYSHEEYTAINFLGKTLRYT
eukprot:CAMPEP_0179369024 /NCGR_PEP_ID=MMETSP0797-20121207/84408_1 /TAXON_ID=47934 /ORGANISM="Dinophysis acuminata, Strain DAEP01" /LENGTH=66 /DNA_ID=CAMNT_0021084655 /DNA_START=9 /DNA_END=206 /DNA_ORIENTATION=+